MNTTNSLPPTARVTCIYHSADNDGKMSACLLRTFFSNVYPYGTNHGQPFNFGAIPNGSYVFIVDFSFKPNEMRALRERCTVIWIDPKTLLNPDIKCATRHYSTCGILPRNCRYLLVRMKRCTAKVNCRAPILGI